MRLFRVVALCACLTIVPLGRSRQAVAQDTSCTDPGTNVPVLLVYGWHGTPNDVAPLRPVIQSLGNVSIDSYFSYPNTDWAADAAVGPALAARIICLADKSQAAGGIGQVVVVAHSMGGLAVRCASDPTCGQVDIGNRLGLVVTLGTPNLGSPLADYAATSSPGSGVSQGLPRAVLDATDALCHLTSPPAGGLDLCDWFLASDPGLQGLRPGSSQLAGLPALRAGVPLVAIAGHISITSQLFFGPTLTLADLGSDGVVSVASAHADAQSGRPAPSADPESACQLPIRIAAPVGGSGDPLADTIADTLLGGLPSCWHGHLPADPTAQQITLNAIRAWIQTTSSGSTTGPPRGGQSGGDGQAAATNLTDTLSSTSDCDNEFFNSDGHPTIADGQTYEHAVLIYTGRTGELTPYCVDADLERKWSTLHVALALTDDSPSSVQAHVVITGDGRTIFDGTVAYGQTEDLNLDVTGVLRLHVTSACVGQCDYYNITEAQLVLGDGLLTP